MGKNQTGKDMGGLDHLSRWSKVSPKNTKRFSYFYWLIAGIFFVLFLFIVSPSHEKFFKKDDQMTMNDDYTSSLKANLARLKTMGEVKTSLPVVAKHLRTHSLSQENSKKYLARQNAPTRMYSASIRELVHDRPLRVQQVAFAGRGENERFANQSLETMITHARIITHPGFTLASGEFLQAVLETAINSDLPGMVRAVISRPAYAYTGERILIPRGSRLIGQYSSAIMQGQNRLMVIWNRVILPSGVTVQLNSPGTNDLGQAGQGADHVNTHFFSRFGQAALLSLMSTGVATVGVDDQVQYNSMAQYRMAVAQSFQQSAGQSLKNTIAIKPTLRLDQGSRILVFVARDLSFYKAFKELANRLS